MLYNIIYFGTFCIRNKPATEPVMLKVCNIKLSFDIWLVLYIYTSYCTPDNLIVDFITKLPLVAGKNGI